MQAVRGSNVKLGRASSPAIIEFDSTATARANFQWGSGGDCYLNAALTCTLLVHDGPGTLTLTGGTFTTIVAQTGRLVIEASATFTNLYVLGSAVVEVLDGTGATLMRVEGGQLITKRHATTIEADGGAASIDTGSDAVGELRMGGARVRHLSGDISTPNLLSGVYDASRLEQPATIAATAGLLLPAAAFVGEENPNLTVNANLVKIGNRDDATQAAIPGFGGGTP